MATGDLVTDNYTFEFRDFAVGAGTDLDLTTVDGLLGHDTNDAGVDRFGRHGGTAGRMYALRKQLTLAGSIIASSDTDFATKRRNMGTAFAVSVDPSVLFPLVFRLPEAGSTLYYLNARCNGCILPVHRDFALGHPTWRARFRAPDPRIKSFLATTTNFAVPSDTQTLTNDGNADASWVATLIGPAEDPVLTNDTTGQSISFTGLTLSGSQTLVYDSFSSTVKINGVDTSTLLTQGFSWWDLPPGDTDISLALTNGGSATFSIVHRDEYWIV